MNAALRSGTLLGVRLLLPAGLSTLAVAACSLLLDDYAVSREPDAGVPETPCGPLEAPGTDGACERIGVPPDECALGFEADDAGGCTPQLPREACVSTDTAPRFAYPGNPSCVSLTCGSGFPEKVQRYDGSAIYAAPGAPAGGDGTKDAPFATLGAALDAVAELYAATPYDPEAPRVILLGEGTFNESVVVTVPVNIRGVCAERTRIAGADPSRPVVTLQDTEVLLTGVAISGGETGVAVRGGHYAVQNFWIHDVGRVGITVDDAKQHAKWLALATGLVENVRERGIVLRGSDAHLRSIVVRNVGATGPTARSKEVAGLVIEPSRRVPGFQGWDPWNAQRSTFSNLVRSVLVEGMETGIIVEGTDATIESSVLRDVRFGVVARWRPLGPIPGNVTIRQSVIERASEAGVLGWNAPVTVDRTTLRDSGADCPVNDAGRPTGAYPGNAVRARFDTPAEGTYRASAMDGGTPAAPELRLERSLVDGARQGGVLVEGSRLLLDHSIVRNVTAEACTDALGDGVSVYGYGFAPASARVTTSRISSSARAALAAFGAPVELELEGLELDDNEAGVVRSASTTEIVGTARCSTAGRASSCEPSTTELVPAIVGARCDGVGEGMASAPDCVGFCLARYGVGDLLLGEVVVSLVDEPRVAPARTGDDLCAALGGLEVGRRYSVRLTSPGTVPSIGNFFVRKAGVSPLRARFGLPEYGILGAVPTLDVWGAHELDLALGFHVPAFLCERQSLAGHTLSRFAEVCPAGITGARVSLNPAAGFGPYYTSGSNNAPSADQAINGALVVHLNVPPGDYELTVQPPDGFSRVECDASLLSDNSDSAHLDAPNRFHVSVWAGYINNVGYASCVAVP